MPSYVPQRPVPSDLTSRQIGKAVSSAHGKRWAQSINHGRGFGVMPVCAHNYFPHRTNGSIDYWAIYKRTPGVEALRVAFRLHKDFSTTRQARITIDAGTTVAGIAAVSYIGGTPYFLDGTNYLPLPYGDARQSPEYVAYIDVSGWSTSNLYAVRLQYTPLFNNNINGVRSWSLQECPRATLDIVNDPTNEPGVDEAWPDVRNRVHAGTTGTASGLVRIAGEIDVLRTQHRRHLQINCPGENGQHVTVGSQTFTGIVNTYWTANNMADAALTWVRPHNQDLVLRCRPRKLYQSTPGNAYRFAAIYSFDPAWVDFTNSHLKVQSDTSGVGGAGTTTTRLALTNTGALGTYVLGSVGGHGQFIDGNSPLAPIEETSFLASTADNPVTTSAECRVLCLALIEEET